MFLVTSLEDFIREERVENLGLIWLGNSFNERKPLLLEVIYS